MRLRLRLRAVAQRYAEEARRGTKGLFWNADKTDLAEARGFFNFVDLGL